MEGDGGSGLVTGAGDGTSIAGDLRCCIQWKRMEAAPPWKGLDVADWWHGMEVPHPMEEDRGGTSMEGAGGGG